MYKRRRYDIDDPRYHQSHRGHHGGHGHGGHGGRGGYRDRRHNNNRQERSDFEDPVDREQERMSRIRQLLVRIGERSSSSLSHNLDQLSKALLVDLGHYRTFIIATLFECIAHLCIKIPIYATLVGLINAVQQDFGEEVLKKLSLELSVAMIPKNENDNNNQKNDNKSIIADTSVQRGLSQPIMDFNRIRALMRFAACLHNVKMVKASDLINLIEFLIKHGMDLKNTQMIQEHSAYIVMSTIIYSAQGLHENESQTFTRIMEAMSGYVEKRPNQQNCSALRSLKNMQIDFLKDVWTAIMIMIKEKQFTIESIQKPYLEFSRLKKEYNEFSLSLNIETIPTWNGLKMNGLNPIWIEFGIAKLLDSKVTKDDDAHVSLIDKYVVVDFIHDIMEYFNQDTKQCAEQLINLPSSFESKYLVIEGIMTKMLRLPSARHHYIFYGKVMIELFRKQTKVWPRIVGPTINGMFHNIKAIDIECRDRLIEWFSFHLANFNFQWPWENWSQCVSFPLQSPKRVFVESIMQRCLHLSFHERFIKTLPDEIMPIVPKKIEFCYKYSSDSQAAKLLRMLNQRISFEDITNHLDANVIPRYENKTNENENKSESALQLVDINSLSQMQEIISTHFTQVQDIKIQQLDMLFTCILNVGKSSCSHVLSFLKVYGKDLKELTAVTPYGQLVLIECLFEYWTKSAVRIEILCDKFHAMNYISPQAIVKFVFLEENLNKLHCMIYWMTVNHAMDRIVKTTAGMQRGIAKFQTDIDELNKNLNSDFNDQEMTINSKKNKENQLNNLVQRLEQTNLKIKNVLVLFFKECIRTLHLLIEKMKKEKLNENNETEGRVDDEGDNQVNDEMEDDLLMSETFIQEQEKKDKEIERRAIMKSMESNTSKYLFDIVCGRMIAFYRTFAHNITDQTWDVLKNQIFEFENENETEMDENRKQIINACQSIQQLRQLTI